MNRRVAPLSRLRACAVTLAVTLLAPTSASADILSSRTFESETLVREITYSVYLPPGYDAGDDRFPVLYLLHGLGDDETTWERAGIEAMLDNLIAAGSVAPLIVVMPDAGRSWYADTDLPDGPGNTHVAIRDDLVAHVDAAYRTVAEPAARALAGHSMGAQGALSIGFDAPGRFGMVAAMNLSPGPRLIGRIRDGETISDDRASGMMGGAYGVPFRAELYIADLPETRAKALTTDTAPQIYLHASDDDPYDTHLRTVDLYRQLQEIGIKPELRITDGGHSWDVWKRELPRIITYFAGTE